VMIVVRVGGAGEYERVMLDCLCVQGVCVHESVVV
jgi:hypothetical protein